jgi:hypothetical protein
MSGQLTLYGGYPKNLQFDHWLAAPTRAMA